MLGTSNRVIPSTANHPLQFQIHPTHRLLQMHHIINLVNHLLQQDHTKAILKAITQKAIMINLIQVAITKVAMKIVEILEITQIIQQVMEAVIVEEVVEEAEVIGEVLEEDTTVVSNLQNNMLKIISLRNNQF